MIRNWMRGAGLETCFNQHSYNPGTNIFSSVDKWKNLGRVLRTFCLGGMGLTLLAFEVRAGNCCTSPIHTLAPPSPQLVRDPGPPSMSRPRLIVQLDPINHETFQLGGQTVNVGVDFFSSLQNAIANNGQFQIEDPTTGAGSPSGLRIRTTLAGFQLNLAEGSLQIGFTPSQAIPGSQILSGLGSDLTAVSTAAASLSSSAPVPTPTASSSSGSGISATAQIGATVGTMSFVFELWRTQTNRASQLIGSCTADENTASLKTSASLNLGLVTLGPQLTLNQNLLKCVRTLMALGIQQLAQNVDRYSCYWSAKVTRYDPEHGEVDFDQGTDFRLGANEAFTIYSPETSIAAGGTGYSRVKAHVRSIRVEAMLTTALIEDFVAGFDAISEGDLVRIRPLNAPQPTPRRRGVATLEDLAEVSDEGMPTSEVIFEPTMMVAPGHPSAQAVQIPTPYGSVDPTLGQDHPPMRQVTLHSHPQAVAYSGGGPQFW